MNKTKKLNNVSLQQKKEIEALIEFFEERDGGYYERERMFEVNVKRNNDYVDAEGLIKKQPRKYQKRLTEWLTNDIQNDLCWRWLEYECEYWIKDFIIGGCGCEKDCKCIRCRIIGQIDEKSIGLYGRSGGHFCFQVSRADSIASELNDMLGGYIEDITAEDIKNCIKDAQELQSLVLEFKTWIDKMNRGMKFEDELIFRIEEKIEEFEEDDKKAKTPAIVGQTLGQLLTDADEVIRRHALGILKRVNK